MFQSYILNIPIYVLLLLQCHINGAKGYGGVESYQNFMEEFVKVVHQEVHKSLNTSMYHVHLPAYLVTEQTVCTFSDLSCFMNIMKLWIPTENRSILLQPHIV
uniref:Putative secreted protein n=1 Tax=Ixodes ricinus TaxID=34613 RepID=A0A6B0UFN3_IXORI